MVCHQSDLPVTLMGRVRDAPFSQKADARMVLIAPIATLTMHLEHAREDAVVESMMSI
jgi:hypothetical protein